MQLVTGASPHAIMVCSIPKSGTYMVGELLRLMACKPTMMHIWQTGFSDYRFATQRERREQHERFSVSLPVEQTLKLILPGQFALSHLECTELMRDQLRPFKCIFVYRDLRDASVSYMRFYAATGRGGEQTQHIQRLPDGPERMLQYFDHFGADFLNLVVRSSAGTTRKTSLNRLRDVIRRPRPDRPGRVDRGSAPIP